MKAFYKIHDKPRGRWRPLLEWGISFSPQEEKEADELNLNKAVKCCFRHSLSKNDDNNKYAGKICPKNFFIIPFTGKIYSKDSPQEGRSFTLGEIRCCSTECPLGEDGEYYKYDFIFPTTRQLRLEWRPGQRPDYSDYIKPIRTFLYTLLAEIEHRFAEARESAPSDEWFLEEEFDSSWNWNITENEVETTEKRLRVIRK